MDQRLAEQLIAAGNEAKKRQLFDKYVEAKKAKKEPPPVKEERKVLPPWTDEQLFEVLNNAFEANKIENVVKLTNNSSEAEILEAALNILVNKDKNNVHE